MFYKKRKKYKKVGIETIRVTLKTTNDFGRYYSKSDKTLFINLRE